LLLALLTLPFPWLEVRCSGGTNAPPSLHYTQTGLQVLAGRCTMPEPPPDGARSAAPSAPVTKTRSAERANPLRQAVAWVWLLSIGAGIGFALAGRTFVQSLLSLIFAAASALLILVLMVVVIFEEAFNSLTFTPWPLGAFLLCLAATAGSTTALVILRRAAPSLHPPDPDEDEGPPAHWG
jgi:hypothetical protein